MIYCLVDLYVGVGVSADLTLMKIQSDDVGVRSLIRFRSELGVRSVIRSEFRSDQILADFD